MPHWLWFHVLEQFCPRLNRVTDRTSCKSVAGPVHTLHWDDKAQQQDAQRLLRQYAAETTGNDCGPVLIKKAIRQWPALQKWTLDWLAAMHGHQR